MPVAAVPSYLRKDFKDTSPGMRFGLFLPIWTTREDQETEVRNRAQRRSREGQEVAEMLQQRGMDATITVLRQRQRNPLPALWGKNDGAARNSWNDIKALTQDDHDRMKALVARQAAVAQTCLQDRLLRLDAVATAPFTTGLGNEHPLENGFAFLNPYGLPYLPGSGVKGVLRQAATELASGAWNDRHGWSADTRYRINVGTQRDPRWLNLSMLDVLFGRETEEGDKNHVRGALSFWDVIPQIKGESLMVEIMSPHQSYYYQQKRQAGSATPHDSGQPTPICFLTVPPESRFMFHVVCDVAHLRRLSQDKMSQDAPDLLAEGETHWKILLEKAFQHAFTWLGFGAKTAVGYGTMQQVATATRENASDSPRRETVSAHPRSLWVDQKLAELCSKLGIRPDDQLRGTVLAEAVRAIEDPALRTQALADIVARWQAKGWWGASLSGAAKKAKAIYDELLNTRLSE